MSHRHGQPALKLEFLTTFRTGLQMRLHRQTFALRQTAMAKQEDLAARRADMATIAERLSSAESLAARNLPTPTPENSPTPLTVAELLAAYWRFVKSYYVKDGQPTSEQSTIFAGARR